MKDSISVNSLNKITENLDIVKVVSEYLNLKKTGKNFKALCPFHEEKTPSFVVNPEKQIFHCFGCGIGGDAIKFLMSIENIPFPQAVALAAEKTGISIDLGRYARKDTEEYDRIYRANEFALKEYQSMLFSEKGKIPLDYLFERNLGEADIRHFSIGFAPNASGYLVDRIKKEKLDIDNFISAGLVKSGGESDVFRNRVLFPIFDVKGRPAGFGGRALDDKYLPKYLNTGENLVFNKGKLLYGINWATEAIKGKGFALLVEGYFDVIKLHINGIKNVVAPMGTSLTGLQLNFLKRFTDNILLLFDSDQAGIRASLRNLETVLAKGFETKVCLLPAGFDPDKFLDDYGINPFVEFMNKSAGFMDFVFDVFSGQYGLDTPRGKSSVAREVMRYIEILPDEIEKSEYRKKLAGRLDVKEEGLSRYIVGEREERTGREEKQADCRLTSRNSAESFLVQILLADKNYWEKLFAWEGEVTPRINLIAKISKELLSKNIEVTPSNLITGIGNMDTEEDISGWLADLALKDSGCLPDETRQVIFDDCLKKLHKICLCEKLDAIKREINTKQDNGLLYAKNLETLQTLLFELKKE